MIEEQVATLPGLDGRKMSKSYDNTIPLFSSREQLKKLIGGILTDSRAPGEPKDTEGSALFQIYQAFASEPETAALRQAYGEGIAWGEAKQMLFARIDPDPKCHYVYLMYQERLGYRVGVTRGARSGDDKAIVSGLQMRTNGEVADKLWILAACDSPSDARYLESYFSAQYGLPTMVFHVRGRRMALTQSHIDRLYQEIDTRARAQRLMADLRLFPEYPHHRPGAITRGGISRKIVHFTMFGDPRRREWHEHRIQLVSSDEALWQAVSLVAPPRRGKRRTWRVETSRKDYDKSLSRRAHGGGAPGPSHDEEGVPVHAGQPPAQGHGRPDRGGR